MPLGIYKPFVSNMGIDYDPETDNPNQWNWGSSNAAWTVGDLKFYRVLTKDAYQPATVTITYNPATVFTIDETNYSNYLPSERFYQWAIAGDVEAEDIITNLMIMINGGKTSPMLTLYQFRDINPGVFGFFYYKLNTNYDDN